LSHPGRADQVRSGEQSQPEDGCQARASARRPFRCSRPPSMIATGAQIIWSALACHRTGAAIRRADAALGATITALLAVPRHERISLNDSGGGRGWLLIVLCLFSAVVSGWRVAVLPDVLGAAPAPTAPGRAPFRGRGGGVAGQAGSGRAHSRCQQVRKACFQGQVRLIFSTRARAWRASRAGRCHSR
jgi:hypothetical protein